MSVVSPQVPARLRRALGRFVGPAVATLFSLVLASCAGGGFGGAGDASDISGVNPVSQPAPAASGPISPASQRKVAEAVSGLDLGEETPPISPEDIAVSNDSGILDSNPFSSPAPAARSSSWGARADSTRKTQGYKAFEVAVPSENPLMTVAVWISETPPDYPEGKPEQDPEADRKFLYLRLQVFIEVGHVALVEGGGVEVLDSQVIVVEEKRPDPKPQPQPTVVAEPLPVCGSREFRDGEGNCAPILGADLLCPSGTMPANGLTQAELDAGLLSAATSGDLAGACEHLRRGANPNGRDQHKHVPLMRAKADLEMGKLLLNNGADLTVRVVGWWTPLFPLYGVYTSAQIEFYLSRGVDPNFGPWDSTWNPLHGAAYSNKWRSMKLLLDAGADPNIQTTRPGWRGGAPLHYVFDGTRSGSALAVSVLLSGGAEVNARDNGGRSALDLAARGGDAASAEILRAAGGQCFVATGPLCEVVEAATPDPVTLEAVTSETVCESGSLSANGLTQAELDAGLLSEARDNDLAGVCEYLRRGANIEAAESDVRYRRTALAIAANLNYLDLAKMLVANGGDVNPSGGIIKSPSGGISWHGGYTALHYASAEGYLEMVRFLLDEGANIRARWALNGRGVTPLYEASYWGRPDVVALLLSRGAESDGWAGDKLDAYPSALHAAVVNGLLGHGRYMYGRGGTEKMFSDPDKFVYALVVSVLLSGGADPNLRLYASSGDAPLDRAVRAEHSDFASALRDAGGKCFVQTGPLCGVDVAVGFSSSGSGTISAEGDGDALSDGDEVRQGATVMFTATPAAGHYVSGWSGHCAEIGEIADGLDGAAKFCAAAADSDLSVRAEFSEIPSLAGPLCPSGSLSANGLTQAELDEGLLSAARGNNLINVCEYLRRGANIEAEDSPVPRWAADVMKRTPLVIAAVEGRLELARLLLDNGANVNWQSGRKLSESVYDSSAGWSALLQAAGAGHSDVVELLLDRGADINIRWDFGRTALHEAAIFGRASVVELLLDRGVEVDARDLSGATALYGAAWGSNANHHLSNRPTWEGKWDQVLDLLLDAGAEVNARTTRTSAWGPAGRVYVSEGWDGGRTPLDAAVSVNKRSRALKLRSHGGVCHVESGPLCPPSSVAVNFSSSGSGTVSAEGDGDALSAGGEVRQGATVMFTAAPAAGHYVSGWSGNCADAGGVADGLDGTAKSCAVSADSALSVRAEFSEIPSLAGPLCPSGSLSANGMTQAQLDAGLLDAVWESAGETETICEYLRRGANVEAQEITARSHPGTPNHRLTGLMMAAIRGWLEVARLLLDNDADPSRQSGGDASQGGILGVNLSALIYASAWGHAEIVQLLLNRGANINMVDGRGRGALFEASYWGRWDIVQLLLERGANPQIQDDRGHAALHGVTHDRGARLWCGAVSVCPVASASAEQSWAKVVSVLLSAGVDVNARLTSAPRYSPMDEMVRRNYADFAAMVRDAGGKCFVQTGPLCGDVHVAVGFSSSGLGTVSAEGDGDALSDGDDVRQGATVMFTATPAAGHYVSGWSGNCAEIGEVADGLDGTAKSCSISAASDLSVRAEFSEIPSLAGPLCPSGSLSANGLTTAELNMTLRLAARGGDAARACEALRRGAEVNDNLDDSEFTPLQEAVSGGHLEAVKILLANGAEVNKRKGGTGHSPLDLAARDSEAEIAALLRDAEGRCFVETGALCGDIPVATSDPATVAGTVAATVANTVVATIAAGSCPAGTLDANGMTQAQLDAGLILAAQENDATGACEHMRRGANVNAQDDEGGSPLHHTTRRSPVTGLLLDNGANINATDNNGRTPLHRALKYRNIDYWKTRRLLERGADANAPDGEGNPPVHLAIADGWYNVIRMLLDHGADIEGGNSAGETPLHRAAIVDKYNIVRLLADRGADLNSSDNNGRTPLHRAVGDYHRYNGRYIVVRNMIRRGADVNARGDDGGTPLDLATVGRIARLLTDAGGVCFIGENAHCGSAGLVGVDFSAAGSGEIAAHVGDRALTSGERVQKGVTVVFAATPGAGGHVKRWSGACAGIGLSGRVGDDSVKSCRVTVNTAVNAGVFFAGASVAADAPLSCPSGSLSADGLTQAGLNAGLVSAAQANNLEEACEYLRRGADVNARYSSSFADVLTAMSFNERLELARLLVANGADVDGLGHSSPLGYAAYFGYVGIARHLLENGANVNRKSHDLTPLDELADSRVREKPEGAEMSALLRSRGGVCARRTHWVCSGPASVVYAATTTTTVTVTTRTEDSSSPLVLAGDVAGETTVISSVSAPVLTGGATVTARVTEYFVRRVTVIPTTTTATIRVETVETENPGDSTSELIALSTVTNQSPPGIVVEVEEFRRVYERPADAATVAATVANTVAATIAADELPCPTGSLPANGLTQAKLNEKLWRAVWVAAAHGWDRRDDICEYLRRGADIEAAYIHNDWTPLHVATRFDSVEIAALLLKNGANVNAQIAGGETTPLHNAARHNALGVAALLLKNGANIGGTNRGGETALHWAGRYSALEVAALLIENGAVIDATAARGQTPLYFAAALNAGKVVSLLIENGAEADKHAVSGLTPLHFAAQNNAAGIAALLIKSGANVNATTNIGWNSLHSAAWYNAPEVAALLLENGADINARSIYGETALDVARRRDNSEMVAFLETAENPPVAADSDTPAEADALTDRLRERFSGAFNPSPAFGDAFGAVSRSSESFLTRLNSLMRSSAGAGGSAWDSFSGWQRENEHGRMWFSTGQRGDFGFGAGGNGAGGDFSASPFAALVGNGMLAGGETGLGADGKLRIAAFADYQAKSLLSGEDKQWTQWAARGTAIETAMTEAERFSGLAENQTRGAMTELHLGGGDLGVALQAGAVSESDAMLSGTAGDGENLRGLRSRTAFAGLSGAADLFGSGWRLRGSAHLGRSWAESEGMLRDGDLWASAFSAGLERGGWLYSDDGFVLRFSQPLRVESLEMGLIGEDGAGRLGADPSGRQLDVDAAYRLPLSGGGWLLLSAGVRRDGGHSSSSDFEAGALFSVERGF